MSDEYGDDARDVSRGGPSGVLIGLIVVVVVALIFIFQNSDRATIQFLFFEGEFRVWVAIALAIVLGILIDRLIILWWRRSRRRDD